MPVQSHTTCADCAAEWLATSNACAACGGTRRSVAVFPSSAVVAVSALNPGIEIKLGPVRPWYEPWWDVRQRLDELESMCSPGAYQGNDGIRRAFQDFFVACFHVGDWLWEDKSTGVSKAEVHRFIQASPGLRWCEGMANTTKHLKRKSPLLATVRVSTVRSGEKGTTVTLEGVFGGVSAITCDALDVARQSCGEWASFIAARGLVSPI